MLTFLELFNRVQSEAARHRDFVLDTRSIEVIANESEGVSLAFQVGDQKLVLAPNSTAVRQIGEFCGISAKYWDKCSSAPALLAHNVRHWFEHTPAVRMIRTIDNTLRALLSDRFRAIDNIDVLAAATPELQKPGWIVKAATLTEKRLYITAISSEIKANIRSGESDEVVHAAVTISNSEVGAGALTIEPSIYVKRTGATMITETALRKNHIGRVLDPSEQLEKILSDGTRGLQDLAFISTVQDVIRDAVAEARFYELAAKLRDAAATPLEHKPLAAIEITARRFGMNEAERERLAEHLIQGADLTQYGLAQAIAQSGDVDNYDRVVELQRMAATVLDNARAAAAAISSAA